MRAQDEDLARIAPFRLCSQPCMRRRESMSRSQPKAAVGPHLSRGTPLRVGAGMCEALPADLSSASNFGGASPVVAGVSITPAGLGGRSHTLT